jgi:hypothetical protein
MKLKILVLLLILSSFSAIAQKLKLEQASPFTAVKWENNQPIVQFEGEWYDFEALGHLSKKEILYFCKKTYGSRWQKRFSEDLVEVLKDLKYVPNQQVSLKLAKNGNSKEYIGTFTAENRKSCWEYNISEEKKSSLKNKEKLRLKVSKKQALADLEQFQEILNSRSSYAQLSKYNYVPAIKELARAVSEKQDSVDINELANEISKIMSEIGDRHSSVRSLSLSDEALKTYRLKLPFGLAAINNKVIAIHKTTKGDKYTYYKRKYPYIKNIDNRDVEELINIYNYRHKKAPWEAKLARGAEAIERYGALLFKNNETCPKSVQVTFADGKNEIVENIELTYDKKWETTTSKKDVTNANIKETKQFEEIRAGIIGENIAYIKIPSMSSYERNPSLENFLKSTVEGFANTKALIIDVRNNPGGGRDILKTFAGYIVQPQQSPWVANVAYLRTNEAIKGDEKSMSGRYLYSYNSAKFSDDDRKAIDIFNKDFKMKKHFDKSKFSSPFYMVLKAGKTPYVKPVYILVNENSFSAATVFTTAFKGLSNVKIVGVTTDGSSGNSRSTYLDNSKIRVKVSTMLSFQRNGTSLDGNGTKPDIYIPVDIDQVFTGQDTQLEKLVETIKKY